MFKNNPRYYFFIFLIIIFLMYPLAYIGNQIITLAQYKEEISGLESELNDIISVNSDIKNEIDEATSISHFTPSLADIKTKTTEAQLISYYATLANTIKDEDGNKVCNAVKRVYYEG